MLQYVILESGTKRVLGVAHAVDALSACIEVSHRQGGSAAWIPCEIHESPGDGDWLAFELPEPFEEPRTWEMFGRDAVNHGRLAAVVTLRATE